MRNKHLLNSILQNTSCPKGFWGRMILWGMNRFHASLARRGMKQVNWQPQWTVLDIGCGGGANLNRLFNSFTLYLLAKTTLSSDKSIP